MYIWRSKGRRDRRNFLTDGARLWKAPRGSENTEESDELLRIDNEDLHMQFFFHQIRPIMHGYLESVDGLAEIGR